MQAGEFIAQRLCVKYDHYVFAKCHIAATTHIKFKFNTLKFNTFCDCPKKILNDVILGGMGKEKGEENYQKWGCRNDVMQNI